MTVNNGDKPLIVWTNDTGILAVAVEERMCPPSWKRARGSVVAITSRLIGRIPCLKAGTATRKVGDRLASCAKKKHQKETKANWTIVKVIGRRKAFRMDLEDVLVKAELRYHIKQRIFQVISYE